MSNLAFGVVYALVFGSLNDPAIRSIISGAGVPFLDPPNGNFTVVDWISCSCDHVVNVKDIKLDFLN